MTTLVSPPALRLRRPGWRDPRLLTGLVLVGLSVAIGVGAVSAAGRTVPVLATTEPLVPGAALDPDSLVVRDVQLSESAGAYLRRDSDLLDQDLVVVRTVGAGELVPVAAVAGAAALDLRSVAVVPSGALSADVVPGAAVDLWFVPDPDSGQPPEQLAADLTVAEVSDGGGALSMTGAASVHVLVPLDQLAGVLGALTGDGSVEVVPVTGTVPGR
ncbi:hypothetical protein OEB99_07430 [Actinotalea sp. M2MS4P-6]|uniref:hypothetical protein n=1 Tax=Actinotalea sp. M2MS4P-6 TaxID=2983762 RepID=UPI0021E454CC|nr:hypothetical protein [Actinotalea sp. M2MS4P-6]MCV2394133.1 hypothetical protein [Actinotalea sp. M2MS4P-6]